MAMFINVSLLLIASIFLYRGYQVGFVRKFISMVAFFVAWWIASYIANTYATKIVLIPSTGRLFVDLLVVPIINHIVIFVVCFVILYGCLWVVAKLLKIVDYIPVISFCNRIGGCVLGGVQAIFVFFFISILCSLPFVSTANQLQQQTLLKYSIPMAKGVLRVMDDSLYVLLEQLTNMESQSSKQQLFDRFPSDTITPSQIQYIQQKIHSNTWSVDDVLVFLESLNQ